MDPFAPTSGDAGQDFLNQQQNDIDALEDQFGMSNNDNFQQPQDGTIDFFAPQEQTTPADLTTPVVAGGNAASNDSDIDIGDEDNVLPTAGPVPNSFIDSSSLAEVSTPNTLISNNTVTAAAPVAAYNVAELSFKPEAASITAWKEEFRNRLLELDDKEAKLMVEWEEKAKKDLEDTKKRHQEALEKQRQVNLENEKSFIEERESRSKEGGGDIDWAKVSNLCDFNMKTNKKAKDTSRMKSMFLQMKGDAVKSEGKVNGF